MADFRYQIVSDLILIPVTLFGERRSHNASFILDTGASGIIIDHAIISDLGYSARKGTSFSTISSATGKERGYKLVLQGFEALGRKMSQVEVRCHDLKGQGVEGLLGMAFLKHFNWCVHPQRQVISAEAEKR